MKSELETQKIVPSEDKEGATVRDESKSSIPIGSGFNGVVYRPPPAANQPDLDRFCNPKYVLKVTSRQCGMHAVRVAQVVRSGWDEMITKAPNAVVKQIIRSHSPDDYFLLAFDLVRDMSRYPAAQIDTVAHTSDSLRRWINRFGASSNRDELIGIHMLDGGTSWTSWFEREPTKVKEKKDATEKTKAGSETNTKAENEANTKAERETNAKAESAAIDKKAEVAIDPCRHLIEAVIALHSVGIAHLDIHGRNVLIDRNGVPRLIDWESATIDRAGAAPSSIGDQVSSTTAWWAALATGRSNFGPFEQRSKDWMDVANLMQKTALSTKRGHGWMEAARDLAAEPSDAKATAIIARWSALTKPGQLPGK